MSVSIQVAVDQVTESVKNQILSRGTRAVNAIRNAELETLNGTGGGRTYRRPGGGTYTASAPGEVPARRTGNLRRNWTGEVEGGPGSIVAKYTANAEYAGYLEYGTRKMARRPYKDKIAEKALPQIISIYSEPY